MAYQITGTRVAEKRTYEVLVTPEENMASDTLEYCKHHTQETDWKFEKRSWTDPNLPKVDFREFTKDKPRTEVDQ